MANTAQYLHNAYTSIRPACNPTLRQSAPPTRLRHRRLGYLDASHDSPLMRRGQPVDRRFFRRISRSDTGHDALERSLLFHTCQVSQVLPCCLQLGRPLDCRPHRRVTSIFRIFIDRVPIISCPFAQVCSNDEWRLSPRSKLSARAGGTPLLKPLARLALWGHWP
jgi:hypothetical protein